MVVRSAERTAGLRAGAVVARGRVIASEGTHRARVDVVRSARRAVRSGRLQDVVVSLVAADGSRHTGQATLY